LKSFSGAACADIATEDFGHHGMPVKDPEALFSDLQWYVYRAKNTVYFTSYSKKRYDQEGLMQMVAKMVALAPQLTFGYEGARPGMPLPQHLLEAITSIEVVDNFDGYPDQWLSPAQELFEQKGMPLFRVKAAVLRDGPDEQGRASVIMVNSAHAMLEGADSALLTRSQQTGFSQGSNVADEVPLTQRLIQGMIISLVTLFHLILAHLKAPPLTEMEFATLTFKRALLRRVADKLGVRQRTLLFALVMFALNKDNKLDKKSIRAAYTGLDDDRSRKGDDYFRVRTIRARFPVSPDFDTFVHNVDTEIDRIESMDDSKAQHALNMMMKTHRFLARFLPFLYTKRFFRFGGGPSFLVLTLVPPHRITGNLTLGMAEPIYCGFYHPSTNLCAFVPGRQFVTFNFSIHKMHIGQVANVEGLLEKLDAA
jgi:hypothetical protein